MNSKIISVGLGAAAVMLAAAACGSTSASSTSAPSAYPKPAAAASATSAPQPPPASASVTSCGGQFQAWKSLVQPYTSKLISAQETASSTLGAMANETTVTNAQVVQLGTSGLEVIAAASLLKNWPPPPCTGRVVGAEQTMLADMELEGGALNVLDGALQSGTQVQILGAEANAAKDVEAADNAVTTYDTDAAAVT